MTPERFAIIPESVLYDRRISSNAVRVYGALVRHGSTPDDCHPGEQLLAKLTHMSNRNVKRAIAELREAEHIEVVRRGRRDGVGGRASNGYRVRGHRRPLTEVRGQEQEGYGPNLEGVRGHPWPAKESHKKESHKNEKTHARAADNGSEEGDDVNVRVTPGSDGSAWVVDKDTDRIVGLATREYTTAITTAATSSQALAVSDAGFEQFWKAYPRKAGKIDARKAWRQVLAKGANPAAIVAGAECYAADPNREPQYTKLPAGWLRDGRWEDGPLPARTNGTKGGRTRERIAAAARRRDTTGVIEAESWETGT